MVHIRRLKGNPVIRPNMDDRMGSNINGPSLIRLPDWAPDPLGRYYLYFAHHRGKYIRLAYADRLEGPWTIYEPGTLALEATRFGEHIASPDIHIDEDYRRIAMFFHGCCEPTEPTQVTCVAFSKDGIHFEAQPEILGDAYWRVFRWNDRHYALSMDGILFRSQPGELWSNFEKGPRIFLQGHVYMRHLALHLCGDTLWVYYSRIGDCPERILRSRIQLGDDWRRWHPTAPEEVLAPEMEWEGGDLPIAPSQRGKIDEPVRQLRDPSIYLEEGSTYLLYSVAGEGGIAIAELIE